LPSWFWAHWHPLQRVDLCWMHHYYPVLSITVITTNAGKPGHLQNVIGRLTKQGQRSCRSRRSDSWGFRNILYHVCVVILWFILNHFTMNMQFLIIIITKS
jgi:hypothetical protein